MGAFTVDTTCTLPTNLIAYWKLDEASGTRNDSKGANHLTDNNTVTQAVGKVGNAAQFTLANSEYLSIADNADLSAGDIGFTIACWVYPDSIGVTQEVLEKAPAGLGNEATEYEIRLNGTTLTFRVGDNISPVNIDVAGAISAGVWHFIVAWHDPVANTINVQVNNGTIYSEARTTGSYNSAGDFVIGRQVDNAYYFGGRIDEVGFWKKVLTAQERTDLYNGGSGSTYDPSGVCSTVNLKDKMFALFD